MVKRGSPRQRKGVETMDMKLEVVVLPVSDVDRAKVFYKELGWREDADLVKSEDFRLVQVTPPGSGCSIIFGQGITSATPGSAQGLHLIVSDIEAARAELIGHGIDISEVFHDAGGVFHHPGTEERVAGPDPTRRQRVVSPGGDDPCSRSLTKPRRRRHLQAGGVRCAER
jgi:catechol 2,3-dioxygenase-like lactoylglutathione lyase family enzyme